MAALTNCNLLDLAFGNTSLTIPSTLYLGICQSVDGALNITGEPSGNGYARVSIPNDKNSFDNAYDPGQYNGLAIIKNKAHFIFPQATGDWGSGLDTLFLSESSSGGTAWRYPTAGSTWTSVSGDIPRIKPGQFTGLHHGDATVGCTSALLIALIDHCLGKTTFTPPSTVYFGLATGVNMRTGEITGEPSGGNYSRVSKTNNKTTFTNCDTQYIYNNVEIMFPTPSASWGTPTILFIASAASGGWVMAVITISGPVEITAGKKISFAQNAAYINMP